MGRETKRPEGRKRQEDVTILRITNLSSLCQESPRCPQRALRTEMGGEHHTLLGRTPFAASLPVPAQLFPVGRDKRLCEVLSCAAGDVKPQHDKQALSTGLPSPSLALCPFTKLLQL